MAPSAPTSTRWPRCGSSGRPRCCPPTARRCRASRRPARNTSRTGATASISCVARWPTWDRTRPSSRSPTACTQRRTPRCGSRPRHPFAPNSNTCGKRAARPAEAELGNIAGMADSTFDIVSKVDQMEADNALHQAQKEVVQRYDFKNVGASIEQSGEKVLMKATSEERVKAILEVYEAKLIKRGISLRSLDAGDPYASGKEYRIEASLKAGIDQENAKKIGKIIRDEG